MGGYEGIWMAVLPRGGGEDMGGYEGIWVAVLPPGGRIWEDMGGYESWFLLTGGKRVFANRGKLVFHNGGTVKLDTRIVFLELF